MHWNRTKLRGGMEWTKNSGKSETVTVTCKEFEGVAWLNDIMSRSFGARPGTCSGGAVGNAGAKSSKTRNLNETRLAAALLEWAAGEMGYSGGEEGLPSSEEMRL